MCGAEMPGSIAPTGLQACCSTTQLSVSVFLLSVLLQVVVVVLLPAQ